MESFTNQDELHARVGEHILKQYSVMIDQHADRLTAVCPTSASSSCYQIRVSPVSLATEPRECSILHLLASGENRLLTKVLLALTSICTEARVLCHEARTELVPALLLYGEGCAESSEENVVDGEAHLEVARMLPTLQRLLCFSDRARQVTSNLMHQLAVLHDPEQNPLATGGFHLQVVFEQLGDLLASLATLDDVIGRHDLLQEHYTLYKLLVRRARLQPSAFASDAQEVAMLERLLVDLDGRVMNAGLLHDVLKQPFAGEMDCVLTCREFHAEFLLTINNMITQMESNFQERDIGGTLMSVSALLALHARISKHTDAKTVKQIWGMTRCQPASLLGDGQVWSLENFLSTHLADFDQLIDKKSRDSASATLASSLTSMVQNLAKTTKEQCQRVMAWTVAVDAHSHDDMSQVTVANISESLTLLCNGLSMAEQISQSTQQLLGLHAHASRPLGSSTALLVCRRIEVLKAMEETQNGEAALWIRQVSRCASQHAQCRLMKLISAVKKRVSADKKLAHECLDLVSGLDTASKAVSGTVTPQRLLLARLALSLCTQPGVFREGELSDVVSQLHRLQLAGQLISQFRGATSCEFVYWSRSLLPVYLRDLATHPDDPRRLELMMAALRDAVTLLKCARHQPPEQLIHAYESELIETIHDSLLKPLCTDIETVLRLDVHDHLQLDDRNPFKMGLKYRCPLLAMPPMKLTTRFINIRRTVEQYLERTFYNLTAVAQHDWRTYTQMRHLAQEKYCLVTSDPQLPGQTLEQGLDVLEVMRNIHIFVTHYAYNLTKQFFVERESNNKHLNTIGIQHIANSMRTHGTGIIATTINFTYQFLRRKLSVLSQFLFDEQISSRLSADSRRSQPEGGDTNTSARSKYQYQRAVRFERAVRSLGVSSDGLSYLDRCRQLVTQIGGALAFVRLVRSGSLHCSSTALQFVPDLTQQGSVLTATTKQVQLDEHTRQAAEVLDDCLTDLVGNGDRNTAYFRLLEHALSPAIRDEKNRHLRTFHLLVPPLCLSHIQHILSAKERLTKNARSGALFTDDGFSMGVAFLLKLLDLNEAFDSIYWFDVVRDHHSAEAAAADNQKSDSKADNNLQQAISLTSQRLERSEREFDLLFFNISAARVFFRTASDSTTAH